MPRNIGQRKTYSMQFSDRQRLFYLYAREGWRRFSQRWAVGRISALRFAGRTPQRLIVAPTDLRAVDSHIADEIIHDRFPLAGRMLETRGESPFALDLPSRAFALRLHSFSWLRHMRASQDERAFDKTREIVKDWIAAHGSSIHGLAWDADIIAQRIIAWLSHSPVILKGAEHGFYRRFLKSLAFQIRYLRHIAATTRDGEVRLRVRVALAVSSVSMTVQPSVLRRAARDLDRELDRQILPDGGHCSRNPRVGLELLLDLLPLRQTYVNLGHDVPSRLIPAIDRMYPALRFFRHQDGDLALFNGATSTLANELMCVLRYDESAGAPFKALPHMGYERLSNGPSIVIVDTGRPLSIDLSATAHAGSLSFEMSSGRNRFIINSGAPKFAGERFHQLARTTAAQSCVTLNDVSSARTARSRYLGPIWIGGVTEVKSEKRRTELGHEGLKALHDGYLKLFGLLHERDIEMNANGTLIRGRDRFIKPDGTDPGPDDKNVATARFHIHPQILIGRRSDFEVMLKAPDGECWSLSTIDTKIEVEDDVFFADPSGLRPSSQVSVRFALKDQPEIQWVLSRETR